MLEIELRNNKTVCIDDADLGLVMGYSWYPINNHGNWYVIANLPGHGTGTVLMHRIILGLKTNDGIKVDHKDGNGLNNQRENLRIAKPQQNRWNSKPVGGSSQYKGVNWHRFKSGAGKWRAQAMVDGKQHHLGLFTDEEEAARVVDAFYVKAFGEFAWLNFPLGV